MLCTPWAMLGFFRTGPVDGGDKEMWGGRHDLVLEDSPKNGYFVQCQGKHALKMLVSGDFGGYVIQMIDHQHGR